MTNTRRTLIALALLALVGAGCSSTPDGAAIDAGGGNAASVGAVRFAECMRANGVTGFPDPDPSGELTIDGVVNGSSLDPSSAEFTQALDACEDLQPPGFTGPDELSPEQLDARLEFARCVRANGVADFPDPLPDAPLVDTNRIPSTDAEGGMAILNAAMEACGDVAAVALGER